MLAVVPDVVGMFGCLLQEAHHGTDLSDDKCYAAPGNRCLLRHLALRVQHLVVLKT